MEHFIAYHSAQTMGYEFDAHNNDDLNFFSRKLSVLKRAIGNAVWVIQGVRDGKKTAYSLCGSYIADQVDVEDSFSNLYVITGHRIKEFSPPVPLNNLDWFPAFLKSQANFSFGFSRINDETVIQALTALQSSVGASGEFGFEGRAWVFQEEADLDEPLVEGASFTVRVNAFERNPIARKKCIEHYGANCSICGFNFGVTYGASAEGYIHIHHLKPLASIGSEYIVDPIKDLRPVCANCHAVIHLRQPPYTIKEIKSMLRENPVGWVEPEAKPIT